MKDRPLKRRITNMLMTLDRRYMRPASHPLGPSIPRALTSWLYPSKFATQSSRTSCPSTTIPMLKTEGRLPLPMLKSAGRFSLKREGKCSLPLLKTEGGFSIPLLETEGRLSILTRGPGMDSMLALSPSFCMPAAESATSLAHGFARASPFSGPFPGRSTPPG